MPTAYLQYTILHNITQYYIVVLSPVVYPLVAKMSILSLINKAQMEPVDFGKFLAKCNMSPALCDRPWINICASSLTHNEIVQVEEEFFNSLTYKDLPRTIDIIKKFYNLFSRYIPSLTNAYTMAKLFDNNLNDCVNFLKTLDKYWRNTDFDKVAVDFSIKNNTMHIPFIEYCMSKNFSPYQVNFISDVSNEITNPIPNIRNLIAKVCDNDDKEAINFFLTHDSYPDYYSTDILYEIEELQHVFEEVNDHIEYTDIPLHWDLHYNNNNLINNMYKLADVA